MNNDYLIKGKEVFIKVVSLGETFETIIDLEYLELAKTIKGNWIGVKDHNTIYVTSHEKRLHRVIIGAKKGEIVDHINHEGLDNRRKNLRIVTPSENGLNMAVVNKSNRHSPFQNISWDKKTSKWKASMIIRGQKHNFGYFNDKYDALDVVTAFKIKNSPTSTEASIAKGILQWDENKRKYV